MSSEHTPSADAGRPRRKPVRDRLGRYRANLQPRLTPMIDITFLLLLFFLLTMQFERAEGQMPADLPAPGAQAARQAVVLDPIWVCLRADEADQTLVIDITGVDYSVKTWADLHGELVRLREHFGSDEVPVIVRPGPEVSWADALNAYNEARRALFRNIAFAREGDRS